MTTAPMLLLVGILVAMASFSAFRLGAIMVIITRVYFEVQGLRRNQAEITVELAAIETRLVRIQGTLVRIERLLIGTPPPGGEAVQAIIHAETPQPK